MKTTSAARQYSQEPARTPAQPTPVVQQVSIPRAPAPQGAPAGMPVYLRTPFPVSRPGDAQELEAEHVSERVMRMPASGPVAATPGPEAQAAALHAPAATGSAMIQRTPAGSPGPAPAVRHAFAPASGGGSALAPSLRSFMEPLFGADFSGVRIHS